jgi:protein SCO1/2
MTHITLSRIAVVCGLAAAIVSPRSLPAQTRWDASYFPNVELTTHLGERVRFYDLIKGKTVAIELMYTSCEFACPLETARLAQVQALLGDRMGRDVFFFSISIDPARDTPAALKAYAAKFRAGPGWTFLTGKAADIELLSRKLGLYSRPDPDNKDGHVPVLLIGNEATGQWIRASALDNARMTANMITSWVAGYPSAATAAPVVTMRSYAEAKPVSGVTGGQYLFSTKCSACHTLGEGVRIGPDLAGITDLRDPGWLAKYIASPEAMLKAGDPVARDLSAKYKDIRMPNLQLTDDQVRQVIGYLSRFPAPRR